MIADGYLMDLIPFLYDTGGDFRLELKFQGSQEETIQYLSTEGFISGFHIREVCAVFLWVELQISILDDDDIPGCVFEPHTDGCTFSEVDE